MHSCIRRSTRLEALRRAVRIPALSRDWQGSMQVLLAAAEAGGTTGNAGLGPGASTAPCVAWLPPGRGRGFARGKRGRPIVRVRRRRRFAAATGTTGPTHPGPHEAEPGRSRGHSELFAVRSARHAQLSDRRQERARPRQRLSPSNRTGGQSPGGQRSSRLVHAGGRCGARRPDQRRCRRDADAGDVACCGRDGPVASRPVWWLHSARDRAHHSFAEEADHLLAGSGFASLRDLQPAVLPGDGSARISIEQAISRLSCFRSLGFRRRPISICVGRPAFSRISRRAWRHGAFPGRGSTSKCSGPRPRSRQACPASPLPCRIVQTVPRAADPW